MTTRRDRVALLLGAGASADAGLPLTARLAEEVIRAANDPRRMERRYRDSEWVGVLNFVYSSMVGYQGLRGDDPLRAVNIETLISALRLLRARDSHEVAPFVATWSAGFSAISSAQVSQREGERILKAVGESITGRAGFASRDVANAVASIARSASQPYLTQAFADAEDFVLKELIRLLGTPDDTTYFDPILDLARDQIGGVDVITLNYDLTIELAAREASVTVQRGIETWRAGAALRFPSADGTLNLIKLHGSLDWELDADRNGRRHALQPPEIAVVDSLANRPWVVVGDREKLATDGPTLALLVAAQEALSRADHLAIIGYSFGDQHVNSALRDWLSQSPARTVSILDKYWPRLDATRPLEDFRSTLITLYGRSHTPRGGNEIPARLTAVTGSAREMLATVLESRPAPPPNPYALADASEIDGGVEIHLRLIGPSLSDVSLHAELPRVDTRPVSPSRVGLFAEKYRFESSRDKRDQVTNVGARLDRWEQDETVTLYAATSASAQIEVHVRASTPVGTQQFVVSPQGREAN